MKCVIRSFQGSLRCSPRTNHACAHLPFLEDPASDRGIYLKRSSTITGDLLTGVALPSNLGGGKGDTAAWTDVLQT